MKYFLAYLGSSVRLPMYQAFFFAFPRKKKRRKKRLIAGQANLDLSGVANLGNIKCKLTSVYLIT